MNKVIVVILLAILCTPSLSIGQIPFHDAVELSDHLDNSGQLMANDSVYDILDKYVEPDKVNTKQEIFDAFSATPIGGDPNPFIEVSGASKANEPASSGLVEGLIGGIGGLNVTNIADGLAKFLVERAKQELSIAFFSKFKDALDKQKQLQILFPTTFKNLSVIGDEIYQFSAYIEMLRQGFQKDLANILPNLQTLVDDSSMDAVLKELPQLRIILSDGLYIATQLKNGDHVGDAFNSYVNGKANKDSLATVNKNLYPSIVLLNIFSQSLKSVNAEGYWISSAQFQKLENFKVLSIYIGLIYHQIKNFQKENQVVLQIGNHSVTEFLENLSKDVQSIKNLKRTYLEPLVVSARVVDKQFVAIKKQLQSDGDKPGYEDYFELMQASINFIEQIKTTYTAFNDTQDKTQSAELDQYLKPLQSFGNIYVDINQKNYVSVVSEVAYLYDNSIIKKLEAKIQQGQENVKALLEKHQEMVQALVKYGNFVAIVAKAENSDQVKDAIEAVALPAGSARIKRVTPFNVALNGYLGAHYGNEYLEDQVSGRSKWSKIYGMSAPVGVTISTDLRGKKGSELGSISLMLSLVDIGAIASFRTQNDSTANIPELKFENILAPGAYAVWGIPKTPLSIGYGWQRGPQLREITTTVNGQENVIESSAYRWSFFFAVDIPIINFYTKTK